MGVCVVTGGKCHYSGSCRYNAKNAHATGVVYVYLRVKASFHMSVRI